MKYTANVNEMEAQRTALDMDEVEATFRELWPELSPKGAWMLAAQLMQETRGGKNCFNWNLSKVKAGPDEQHMYLRDMWEVDSSEAQVARAKGMAHIATADEIQQHGWPQPQGATIVVFEPPHPQCRFRAYNSLADGARRWLEPYQRIAAANARYFALLNG